MQVGGVPKSQKSAGSFRTKVQGWDSSVGVCNTIPLCHPKNSTASIKGPKKRELYRASQGSFFPKVQCSLPTNAARYLPSAVSASLKYPNWSQMPKKLSKHCWLYWITLAGRSISQTRPEVTKTTL